MNKFISIIKLIRWPNLLIMAFTMLFFYHFVTVPDLYYIGALSYLNEIHVLLLILASVCIAAGGYVINDLYDMESDRLNHPDRSLVKGLVTEKFAMNFYYALNALGLIMAALVCYVLHSWSVFSLFVLAFALLWVYTQTLKNIPLIGNLSIAVLSALPIWILVLMERKFFIQGADPNLLRAARTIFIYALAYSFFAFLVSLIREIVKDLQDMEGDRTFYQKTLPLVAGIRFTKTFLIVLLSILFFCLVFVAWLFGSMHIYTQCIYIVLLLALPSLYLIFLLLKASNSRDYSKLSLWLKLIMVAGIFSLPVFNYFVR